MSINRVILSGNLTRDPEVRQTASDMAVMQFGLAVNDRVKNGDQWEDRPNFVDCTMFGSRAESVSRFISKGSKVTVEGKLRWSQWEKDGQKRSKIEVVVDEIEFMSAPQSAAQPPMQQQAYPQPQYQQPAPQMAPQQGYAPQYQQPMMQQYQAPQYQPQPALYDGDIPF